MKKIIIFSLSIFFANFLLGQNFSNDYFEHLRPSWEKLVTEEDKKLVNPKIDSMIFLSTGRHIWEVNENVEKEKAQKNINYYKKIMQLKGIDIDKQNNFILIEESALGDDWSMASIKNGIVILNNKYFSYSINLEKPSSLILTNNFLKDFNSIDKNNARSILFNLAKNNEVEQIVKLAIKEMNDRNPDYETTKQYEVLIYNFKSSEKIRLCYLHELLTQIYK